MRYFIAALVALVLGTSALCIIRNRADHVTPQIVVEEHLTVQKAERSFGDITCTVGVVTDGDTFHGTIADWPPIIGDNILIRVNGIDTPEKHAKDESVRFLANKARVFSVNKLRAATKVELRNMHRDKFFRIDADVYVDNVSLGQLLLDNYLAKPYDGGTKPAWTPADLQKYRENQK